MKRFALLMLLCAGAAWPQAGSGNASTTGACSPAVTGSSNTFNINCGPAKPDPASIIKTLKELVVPECESYKAGLRHMVGEASQGMPSYEFNAYALPKFSDAIRQQFLQNQSLFDMGDPKITRLIRIVGGLDYEHTFSLRNADGTIMLPVIRSYVSGLHNVCDWVGIDLGYRARFSTGEASTQPSQPSSTLNGPTSGNTSSSRSASVLNPKTVVRDAITSEGKNYYTMTTFRIDLFAIQKKPELLTDEFLNEFAINQIGGEQSIWSDWYKKGAPRITPQTWEWQTLIDEQPILAKGPLLDVFLFPQAEWPFVNNTADLNQTGVNVFLFSRSKIEGRDKSFVAREVEPVVKRQLLLASKRSPQLVWFSSKLPSWDWDPKTDSIRFLTGNPGTPFQSAVTLLSPQLQNIAYDEVSHPAGYQSFYNQPLNTAPTHPQEVKPGMAGQSPTEEWRENPFLFANGRARFPFFSMLALDRKAEIKEIKVPVEKAEQLHMAHAQMTALMLLDMQDIGTAKTKAIDGWHGFDTLVVYAKVKKIDIVSSDGTIISSIDSSNLPTGSVTEEKTAATAPAAAPIKGAGKSFAELNQETKDENARRSVEYRTQKNAKTHAERIRNCESFATNRYPDTTSEDHKHWNDQCVKQMNAVEARQQP